MTEELSKAEFKEEFKYSESTYQRRMKEFKSSPFSEGYKAVTGKEIIIDADLFREFRRWKADNSFRVRTRMEATV
ncbi:hypothetical protein FQS90_03520 [Enterococcus casseliflavus]|uniref:hypothetical protein n=1 Tax=Enterococcus sp. 8E11_MSG4843 TaxID=1834190 RepID=UPI000B3E8D71|nr:hypothetical protein [Enterococcus sp. 8E11_MSG4843]MBO1095620.1 hypothetical protein [Enterococcus casseliflavus]MBO1144079.1 hypothetical protein [Enterococcus casseliflavus]OUZ34403.1 hypothetical protein A5885_002134 [Enterococcus sp. 8E11_MSG4843]